MTKQRKFTKCPVCGVSVNTKNLAEHLQRVHNNTLDGGVVRERAEANQLKADTGEGQMVDITACVMALEKGTRLIASRKFKRAINVFYNHKITHKPLQGLRGHGAEPHISREKQFFKVFPLYLAVEE